MPLDFSAKQVRTSQLIASGGLGVANKPHLGVLVYSASKETDTAGSYPSIMLDAVGKDTYMFVSGAIDTKAGIVGGTVVFGGDTVASGATYFEERTAPGNIAAGTIALYGKNDGSKTKLYFKNEDGETEIGSAGTPSFPDAEYVLLSANGTLTNERVLTASAGGGINIIDAGAGGNVSITTDITSASDGTGITVSTSDLLLLGDADDSNSVKRITVSQLPLGSPEGSTTQIQFNDGGAFGGADNLTFDGTDITVGAADGDAKLVFRDSAIYIHSDATDSLKAVSDGTITLDATTDIALSADGGNVTMDDGTTTVFDFDTDNVVFKMMDDANVADYFSIGVSTDGATTLTTVDASGASANLTLAVDGAIDTDSPITASAGIHIDSDLASLQIGAGPDLILSSSSDHAIVGNQTSNKDIIFRVNDGGVDKSLMRLEGSSTTIGIGVADDVPPAATLHVSSAIAASPTIKVSGVSPKLYLESDGDDDTAQGKVVWTQKSGDQAEFVYASGSSAKILAPSIYGGGAQWRLWMYEPGADFAIINRKKVEGSWKYGIPFYVSASADVESGDMVLILSGGDAHARDPQASTDVNFFVSGSKGSRTTATRGTAVFGGDVVISGTLSASNGIVAEAGGTDTQVQFNDSGELAGASSLNWDKSTSRLGIGDKTWAAAEFLVDIDTDEASSAELAITQHRNQTAKNDGPNIKLRRSRGIADDEPLNVGVDYNLGSIHWYGYNDGWGDSAASIWCMVDGPGYWPASGEMPTRIMFKTTPDGSSPADDLTRMVIKHDGKVGIGTEFPSGTLDVYGDGTDSQVFLLSGSGNMHSPDEVSYSDINFFVSGTAGSKDSSVKGTALFGGDVVVSGTLYAEKMIVEVDESVTGSLSVSGSLFVSQSATIHEGLVVNEAGEGERENDTRIETLNKPHAFFVDASADRVLILSGGAITETYDEASGSDVSFYVSGTAGSKGTTTAGTSLFGGDVAISGSLYGNAGGNDMLLIMSGGAPGSADPASFSDANFFVSGTTSSKGSSTRGTAVFGGDLYISGNAYVAGQRLDIGEGIRHIGDTDTKIRFTTDTVGLVAGNKLLINLDGTGDGVVTTAYPLTASAGISLNNDNASLQIGTGADLILSVSNDNAIIGNKTSDKDIIFRVNDGGVDKTLVTMDASTARVGVLTSTPNSLFEAGPGFGTDGDYGIGVKVDSGDDASLDLYEEFGGASEGFGTTSAYGFRWVYDGQGNKLYLRRGEQTTVSDVMTITRGTGNIDIAGNVAMSSGLNVTGSTYAQVQSVRVTDAHNDNDANYWVKVAESTTASGIQMAQATFLITYEGKLTNLGQDHAYVHVRSGKGTSTTIGITCTVDIINTPETSALDKNDFVVTYQNSSTYTTQLWVRSPNTYQEVFASIVGGSGEATTYTNKWTILTGQSWASSYTSLGTDRVGEYTDRTFEDVTAYKMLVMSGASPSDLDASTALLDVRGDGSTSQIFFLSGSGNQQSPDESTFTDTNFFVSGTIGSKDSSTKGTSVFGGDLVTSGTSYAIQGLSGSLTRLTDGTSYLIAGSGISITSASNGAVTISDDGTVGDITSVTAGTGLTGGGTSGDVTLNIDDTIVATLTGSQFSGNVGISGSFEVGVLGTGQDVTFYGKDSSAIGLQWDASAEEHGNLILGASDHGVDFIAYGETVDGSDRFLKWDQSEDKLTIFGELSQAKGNVVFNPYAEDQDFRVGSDNHAYMLFVDGGADKVGINSIQPGQTLTVTGTIGASLGLSGSLTHLTDGTSYLIAGSNVTITSASNGAVTVTSTDTNTTYTAGDGLDLSGTEFSVDNTVVATLTGSQFSGNVGITGSLGITGPVTASAGIHIDSDLASLQIGAGPDLILSSSNDDAIIANVTSDKDIIFRVNDGGKDTTVMTLDGSESSLLVADNKKIEFGSSASSIKADTGSDLMEISTTLDLMVLEAAGRVAVTAPLSASNGIHIYDDNASLQIGAGPDLILSSSGDDAIIANRTSDKDIIFRTNKGNVDTEVVRIDGSLSRVGIGTAEPESTLHVSGAAAQRAIQVSAQENPLLILQASDAVATPAPEIAFFKDETQLGFVSHRSGTLGKITRHDTAGGSFEPGSSIVMGTYNEPGGDIAFPMWAAAGSNTIFDMPLLISGSAEVNGIPQVLFMSGAGGSSESVDPKSFSDTNFYVSGSIGSRSTATRGTSVFGGDLIVSGNTHLLNGLSGSLTQLTDGTSYLIAGDNMIITTGSSGAVTIASTGGGGSGAGVGWFAPSSGIISTTGSLYFGVTVGTTNPDITFASDGAAVFNEQGGSVDFRIESNTKENAFLVDGSTDQILILSGGATIDPTSGHAAAYTDTNFFVSGTIGSRNSTDTKGTSVFGGDVHISGSITSEGSPLIGISGTPANNQLSVWTNANTVEGDADLTWDGTTLYATSAGTTLNIQGDANINGTLVVNQGGNDKNFRVETQNKSSAVQVDGETDQVLLFSGSLSDAAGYGSSAHDPDPREFTDTNFFVSGSIGSKDSSTKGTSVFGGDAVVSGALQVSVPGVGQNVTFYGKTANATGMQWIPDEYENGVLRLGAPDHGVDLQVYGETAGSYLWWNQDDDLLAVAGKITHTIGDVVFNEGGTDADFRVESVNNDYMLFVDAGNDRLGIGSTGASPETTVHIKDSSPAVRIQRSSNSEDSTLEFAGSAGAVGAVMHISNSNDLVFKTHDGSSPEEMFRIGSHYGSLNRQIIFLSGSGLHAGAMQPKEAADISFFVSGAIGSRDSLTKGVSVFGGDLVVSGTSYAMQGLSGSLTRLTDGTSYLIAGSGMTITSASNGAVTLASDGTTYTAGDGLDLSGTEFSTDLKTAGGLKIDSTELAIDDTVVATLTGSQFSGNIGVTGSLGATVGLSGSLTQLTDGTSYLIAGSNVTITSASNGAVTVTSTDTNTTYTAGDGLDLSGTEFSTDLKSSGGLKIDSTELAIDDTVVATLTGSQFSGNIGVTGSIGVTLGLSGSLTQLTDGTSYLIAGSNVTITSASNGAVTVAATDTNTTYTAGDGLDLSGTEFSTDLKSDGGLKIDSTELAIDNTIVATLTGSQFSGNVGVTGSMGVTLGLSGSLTQLTDGTSYLIAGTGIAITSASNGAVTIANDGTVGDITGVTAGTGLTGGGTSGTVTLNVDNTTVATLTGSQFSGNVGITGSLGATTGLSGSLTQLTDGTSYLIAGSNVTITSASNGAVTIVSTDTNTTYTAGDGLDLSGTEFSVDNTIVATLTGSQFSGNVGVTGSVGATLGLSGSLTHLTDGSSYLIAGANVTITSASNGAVTIASTGGGGGSGAGVGWIAPSADVISTSGSVFFGVTGGSTAPDITFGSNGAANFNVQQAAVDFRVASDTKANALFVDGSTDQVLILSGGAVIDPTYGHASAYTDTNFFVSGTIGSINSTDTKGTAVFGGDVYTSGALHVANGLSGSLTRLTDGTSYLIAGSNVTITSASSGAVTIASTGGGGGGSSTIFTDGDNKAKTTGSISIDASNGYASAIGSDIFFYVSGARGGKEVHASGTAVFGGDVITSGNVYFGVSSQNSTFGKDTSFFVSGTIGSRNTTNSGSAVFGGDIHISGGMGIGSYLVVTSSTTATEIDVSSGDLIVDVAGDIIFDADGDDIYFRAGADDENGLRLRAQSNGEWVALASTAGKDLVFTDADDANEYLRLDTGMAQLVVNDNSKNIDFRVESNNKTYGFFVDASEDKVLILSGGSSLSTNEAAGADISMYVSGAVSARGGSNQGVTVFGGDIHISGNLSVGGSGGGAGGSSTVWTDGGDKTKTTGSVSIDGSNQYVSAYGSDVFFYVSGSTGDRGTAAGKMTVFNGDAVHSGSVFGLGTISGSQIQTATVTSADTITLDATTDIILDADGDDIYFRAGTSDESGLKFHQQSNGEWAMMASAAGKDILFTDAIASNEYLRLDTGGAQLVVNDNSKDIDFRVESNNSQNMLFVDAANDKVGINTSTPTHAFSVVGAISASMGISGSLTRLVDGTSYLIAGSNVTITSASNGAVTIAGSGAAMDIVSGSTTISSIDKMNVSKLGIIQDLGSGDIAITGSIGVPEDGTYSDGLFTDFGEATPVGTAVDRFNEVLKALAPSPAPALDDVNSNETGTTTLLSFGSSNNQSSGSPPYISVGSSAGLESAVDVNGSYAVTTSSNNIRIATFTGTTAVSGVLNADVSSNSQGNSVQNYPAFSFGDGDSGVLKLVVNGSTIKEIDLTSDLIGSGTSGLGTGSYVDGDGSGFNFFSQATTGTFSNGNAFNSFKHRTGQYVVAAASQRDGWNYVRVQHIRTGSTQTTNYTEWVNDSNSDALAAAGESISFTGSGSVDLSGISYYRSGTATYKTRVTNAYKYTYDSNDITFTTANSAAASSSPSFTISDQSKPSIDTGAGETQAKTLHLTGSSTVSATYFLSGAVTASINVTSPLKSDLSGGGSVTVGEILMYDSTDTNTVLAETFMAEGYRVQSASFDVQADVTGGSYDWTSSVHMTGSNTTYLDGLQYYRDRLYSPLNTTNNGDFSTFTNAPSNPNYSGISGLRTFYRKFQNTSGGDVRDISYLIAGDGTIEDIGTTLGANDKFRVFFKLPSNGTNNSGWLDAATAFTYNQTGNRQGCYIGTFTDSVGTTNYATWGTGSIGNNEYIVAKIEADAAWTGYLDSMTIAFGAVGSVIAAPNVNDVDVDTSGTAAKLSFGSSLALTDYTNVGTTAGNAAVDANGTYSVTGNRYGVYGPTITSRIGTINETTTSPGNSYPADAFGGGNANTGSLKLEVNGAVIQTTDLATFANGSDLNGDGSGFTLTTATPGEDSSDLPDYTKFYRTGTYTVVSASQTDGWNYARVTHTVTGSDYESTYVEWVNDISNPTISLNNVTIGGFGSATTNSLSGIKYFISPSGSFRMRASNVYKYVYSSNASAISFPTTTNSTITDITGSGTGVTTAKTAATSTTLPSLNTGVALAYDYDLFVTGTFDFDQATSIPGGTAYTATVSGRVNHPLQGNTTTSSTQSNEVLAATISDTSTTISEPFTGEGKRLIAGSYTNQSDVVAGGNAWDSTISLDGGNASYNTGLAVYNGELASPQNIGLSGDEGDFRDVSESGPLEAPLGNPDYSSLTNSTREYIRSFTQTAAGSKSGFDVTITGTGTIVAAGTSLASGNNINVFFKLPNTDAGFTTGWMDLATAFATGQYDDDDGCLSGTLTSSITSGATNTVTFGVKSVDQNEYIVIKIVADKTWTGNIETATVSWS
jgi:hypothetical protein